MATTVFSPDIGMGRNLSLLRFRKSIGLTQWQFAWALGVTERSYRNYEKGKPIPTQTLKLISLFREGESSQVRLWIESAKRK